MNFQHQQVLEAAQKLGVEIIDIQHIMGAEAHILRKNHKEEVLVNGTPTSIISLKQNYICNNKQLTKVFFEQVGIPHPKSVFFTDIKDESLTNFIQAGRKYPSFGLE